MASFYLKENSSTETFDLDTEAVSFSLGDVERNYEMIQLFSDKIHIRGQGGISPGQISISRDFRKESYNIAWNNARKTILNWIGMSKTKELYFYIVDDSAATWRCRIYPVAKTGENYIKTFKTDQASLNFQMQEGYFQKTTDTYAVTGTTLEAHIITNAGNVATPPLFTFTPTAAFSLLQIQTDENYGFRLQTSFLLGQVITFDCATGAITVNGQSVSGIQTGGSVFKLEPGINNMEIYATAGSLVTTYYERVI
jgi:hypothetical protein